MDTNVLVESGRRLLTILDREGIKLRAAVWVHNRDSESWRLWIVPQKGITDKVSFYRQIAQVMAKYSAELSGIDIGDTQFVPDSHPAIAALGRIYHLEGTSSVQVSDNMLNGFYLPDGIILRMAV